MSVSRDPASPYDRPDLYDLMLDGLDFDQAYWLAVARGTVPVDHATTGADASGGRGARARGEPVLDVGCGTGRVLLRLLEAGVDADGLDASSPMLERARARAAARGFRPALVLGDMRDFTMPRRYARAICAFNAFAHMETPDDQLRALRCVREHLEPDGALVLHMSYPRPAYWSEPDGVPVLELEVTRAEDGRRLQMWDTRFKDPAAQRQQSRTEIRELDAAGATVATHRSETVQRWVYRWELELLLRLAGYARWEFFGGFAGEPFQRAEQPLVAWGWRS